VPETADVDPTQWAATRGTDDPDTGSGDPKDDPDYDFHLVYNGQRYFSDSQIEMTPEQGATLDFQIVLYNYEILQLSPDDGQMMSLDLVPNIEENEQGELVCSYLPPTDFFWDLQGFLRTRFAVRFSPNTSASQSRIGTLTILYRTVTGLGPSEYKVRFLQAAGTEEEEDTEHETGPKEEELSESGDDAEEEEENDPPTEE
ncbi:MAG: hypothetical protein LUD68_07295, partial [Rikenellaceae bacterium]|nr:hypothetical protein [Rikenellaceae bacterium]